MLIAFCILTTLSLNAYKLNTDTEVEAKRVEYNEIIVPILKVNSYSGNLGDLPISSPLKTKDIERISDWYGHRTVHPVLKVPSNHKGIDISALAGTLVQATANGVVVESKFSRWGYGNRITVYHKTGYSTTYTHLKDINVKVGDKVRVGNTIGTVGNTGRSTGPHLHYEIRKDGKAIDPLTLYFEENDPQAKQKYIFLLKKIEGMYFMFN